MELLKSNGTIEEKSDMFDRLPDELVSMILNKLDKAVNLVRFGATCKRVLQLPSQIRSLSTSLPLSILKTEESSLVMSYVNYLDNFWNLNESFRLQWFDGLKLHHARSVLLFCFHMKDPILPVRAGGNVSNSRLFERFSSLDSLVVTLETSVSDSYGQGRPWFLWDAELYDNAKPKGYVAVVLGNVVGHDIEAGNIGADASNLIQLYKVLGHVLFHRLTAKLLLSKGCTKLRSVVTKDADKKGKLRFHRCHEESSGDMTGSPKKIREWISWQSHLQSSVSKTSAFKSLEELWLSERRLRLKFCYTPTLLKLNNSVQINDVVFLFITWVEDDDTTDIDDLIKARLGFGQAEGEDDDRKELKEIAMKILTHEKSKKFVGLRRN